MNHYNLPDFMSREPDSTNLLRSVRLSGQFRGRPWSQAIVKENFHTETTESPESDFDISLRRQDLEEFFGQGKVKERLTLMVEAAK